MGLVGGAAVVVGVHSDQHRGAGRAAPRHRGVAVDEVDAGADQQVHGVRHRPERPTGRVVGDDPQDVGTGVGAAATHRARPRRRAAAPAVRVQPRVRPAPRAAPAPRSSFRRPTGLAEGDGRSGMVGLGLLRSRGVSGPCVRRPAGRLRRPRLAPRVREEAQSRRRLRARSTGPSRHWRCPPYLSVKCPQIFTHLVDNCGRIGHRRVLR